jgi:hypothetical protein
LQPFLVCDPENPRCSVVGMPPPDLQSSANQDSPGSQRGSNCSLEPALPRISPWRGRVSISLAHADLRALPEGVGYLVNLFERVHRAAFGEFQVRSVPIFADYARTIFGCEAALTYRYGALVVDDSSAIERVTVTTRRVCRGAAARVTGQRPIVFGNDAANAHVDYAANANLGGPSPLVPVHDRALRYSSHEISTSRKRTIA